ncbi:MAG TPA: adenylate/guanylate cyclase domain-containing protein [Actinomycetota bacterium]|nr:adenylate/guanylate cyclase domain-containing protein [Actinomycetota bacterium]
MTKLPTGTVTFLFTDIEGSTKLFHELGDRYREVQRDHQRLMREAIALGEGHEMRTEGDSFFVAFPSAARAVEAVVAAQRALADHPWSHGRPLRVRMGMHTGEGRLLGEDYLSIDVNRAARIASAGHGGQVLLSDATRTLAETALPQGVSIADLGRHGLKDFDEPQRLYQLVIDGLQSEFPPLKTLEAPTNLPAEVTSFVGREQEVREVEELLESSRLVTLTGPGGSGKTRLSIRVGSNVLEEDRFRDGVFFVELAGTTDAQMVPSVIASALGIREEGPRPLLETLQSELRHRTALLILDNFEQVIEASRDISTLLAAAPRVRFLVTSRGPLRIQGEREFPVPPLPLPETAELSRDSDVSDYGAVALFVDRATAVDPRFTLNAENARAVTEICRRLDGLPLAIELAASRLRVLTPAAMLDRLDRSLPLLAAGSRDLPARQRTLRGAIAWSYDLLAPELRTLFRRLSVFAGGFEFEAVESVCDPVGDLGLDPLDGLEALLDVSLTHTRPALNGGVRFDMLQTIREFGHERLLEEDDAASFHRRHAEHFVELAESSDLHLRGPQSEHTLELLELEHDNIRAALTWLIANDEGEIGLRLVGALWRFWHLAGHLTDGRRWAEEVLSLPSAKQRTPARARALWGLAALAYWQTDPPPVKEATEEALSIAHEIGDEALLADAMFHVAFWHPFEMDFAGASAILRDAASRYEKLGNRLGVADSLFAISVLDRLQGKLEESRSPAEEALRIHAELGDVFGMTGSLFALGRVLLETGDLDGAAALYARSLELGERMRDRTAIAIALDNFAERASLRGDHERAVRIGGASSALKEAVGGEAPPAMVHLPDPRDLARGHLSEEAIERAWEEGRKMSVEQALAYVREEA